jgi:hypothetical protein
MDDLPIDVLDELFNAARAADEFEYACALLRIRGMESPGWDPLLETQALFNDITGLLDAPFTDHARMRLALLLYSHLTEVDAIYRILANLLNITAGERYVMDPFQDLYFTRRDGEHFPPSAKKVVDNLRQLASDRGYPRVAALVDSFFNDAVRNAFFHSDYILWEDQFRTGEGTFVTAGGRSSSMTFEELADLISRAMAFFQAFVDAYLHHRRSYTADKTIRGRFGADGSEVDITLMADVERGLYGFRGVASPRTRRQTHDPGSVRRSARGRSRLGGTSRSGRAGLKARAKGGGSVRRQRRSCSRRT